MSEQDNIAEDAADRIDEICLELRREAEPKGSERRMSPRYAFPAIQAVAPYDGVTLPAAEMFRPVRCHDLSQRGISFFWTTTPTFKYAVVKLSLRAQPAYLMVRVVRSMPIAGLNNEYLVCCQFLSRVKA